MKHNLNYFLKQLLFYYQSADGAAQIADETKKLKNFFDYYLPVTVKLLDRYDEIENQRLNSKDSKKFNENTLKTIKEINSVFKKFLNILYEDDMTDTNVEIKVLNSMLKADGLGKNEINVEEDSNE